MTAHQTVLDEVPVVLTAYARPEHLRRVLESLRTDGVKRLIAFSDGPRGDADRLSVATVRALIDAVSWASVDHIQRPRNLGLGENVRTAVSNVLRRYEACIVIEDDLVFVPGTYAWMCASLRHYADDSRIMSVTAWTHPKVTPGNVRDRPYFDGRAECWLWGTWARAWRGMEDGDARAKFAQAERRGMKSDAYGADLVEQARWERRRNVWAVRWLAHHFAAGGLCLRPPWSMVEHIGFDASATNAKHSDDWANPPLRDCPPIPDHWPEPREHPDCRRLWFEATAVHRISPVRRVVRGLRRWMTGA